MNAVITEGTLAFLRTSPLLEISLTVGVVLLLLVVGSLVVADYRRSVGLATARGPMVLLIPLALAFLAVTAARITAIAS